MKRKFYLSLLISALSVLPASAQDTGYNYVGTRTMTAENISSYIEKTQYLDGLGRLSQEVLSGITPSGKDLVTLHEYDNLGRDGMLWLPVPLNNGGYYAPVSTLKPASSSYYGDASAYTRYNYEASPLNRLTSEQGPGSAWNGHAVSTAYSLNGPAGACPRYEVVNDLPVYRGSYSDGQLFVTKVTDEDGKVSYAFKDAKACVIMERQISAGVNHDTRYVYDLFGNLRFVLPPMVSEAIGTGELLKYAYCYKYNERKLCTEYAFPGCAAVYMVYDASDRPVLKQDGKLRAAGKWQFTFYDAFGRVAIEGTGAFSDVSSVASSTVTASFSGGSGFMGTGYSVSGITLPTSTELLKCSYYDGYSFLSLSGMPSGLSYAAEAGYDAAYGGSLSGKGQLTGTRSFFTGNTQGESVAAVYYDDNKRIVQQHSTNILGGTDTECYKYSFSGKPLKRLCRHTASGKATQTQVCTYTYDHAERLKEIRHKLNDQLEVVLASNSYDELGRLSGKQFHGSMYNSTYSYNIRSWLTGISGTNFSQNLYYNTGNGAACYNGNISSMTWNGNDGVSRGYKFSYDGLNRMLNAAYGEGSSITGNQDAFTEKVTGYDKNGNITALQRYGQVASGSYGLIDNLSFILNGNRLQAVSDAAPYSAYNGGFEFRNGTNQSEEYTYDANGNLIKDLNKNIVDIQYNYLNLPSSISFSDGSSISYVYDADGTKLRSVHNINGSVTTTDYCGNVIYENGSAKLLLTEAGYVSLNDGRYHYYLQDHQGNNRAVIDQNGSVEETNHYYPFGGVFAGSGDVQPYKYNGKELDTKKGLDWYDYGARHYDAALGRFAVVDSLVEKSYNVSPYSYCNNNPIRYIDPSGNGWREALEHLQKGISTKVSIGLNAGATAQVAGISVGLQVNAGSVQFGNDGLKVTSGISGQAGVIGIEMYDNAYNQNSQYSIKENGYTIKAPLWSENHETITTFDSRGEQYKKIDTEKTVKNDIGNLEFSASLGIGAEIKINLEEIWKSVVELFK